MPLTPGSRVGPYKIISQVGAGGMGEVYRARDTRLDRDVAIKVLPQHLSENPAALKRFEREAKALAALSHPNILTIFDIGKHGDLSFVVMELLEGETLRNRILHESLASEKAIEIITGVIHGLIAAHSQGIIHRDLKPENIFITRDERIKILDFGLAKRIDTGDLQTHGDLETQSSPTTEGTILGTVPYMSPEQARGETLDQKSDIFSTGTIFYELLTGHLPFVGPNIAAIIHKIINEKLLLPSTVNPGLPKWVDTFVERALAKEKENRYSTSSEMLTDLKRHQDNLRQKESKEWSFQVFLRGIRRPRIGIPSIAMLVAISFLAIWFIDRQSKIRWARAEALPEIRQMIENSWRDSTDVFKLAEKAEKYIPNDPELAEFFWKCSLKISIQTDPPGAKVYWKEYKAPESEWIYLGNSPIEKLRVPIGVYRWKLEKEGYETVLAASTTFQVDVDEKNLMIPLDLIRVLDRKQKIPPGMVRVSGAKSDGGELQDFYVHRHEVTNREYKMFVDGGGYAKKEYWKNQFILDAKALSWEEAMDQFVDQTDRHGPATWQAGDYPEGQADYPVSGVSWYEAAAYAEYSRKSLPTGSHWGLAIGESTPLIMFPQLGGFAIFAPFSNFLGKGPVPVGSLPGITTFGAYDMAGNIREWCWNETPKGRLIRGGAWGDNVYTFRRPSQAPAMDRSPKNGFRCALYPHREKIPESAFAMIQPYEGRDYSTERAVSDAVFRVYKEQFSYDKTPLNARVESKKESAEGWIQEKISFDAAYEDDRIIAYLFLPKNAVPPYQTVIYFPGSASAWKESSKDIENYYEFPLFLSFILKNGRAALYPVYKGTFERRVYLPGGDPSKADDSHLYREYQIQLIKDFKRCMDYLESRPDVEKNKIAYYGMSWGGFLGAIIPAVEERLQASVLVAGGCIPNAVRPEVDQINYLSRVKIPTLMLNGKFDTIFPYETSIKPMFDRLGTAREQKELKLYETDHIPPRNEFIKETLAWLDRYLGAVKR